MIITNVKEFKEVCKTVLLSIDNSEQSIISETLEIKSDDSGLILSVTNREYFVSIKFPLESSESFKATVNALLFLRLISQITADSIEMSVSNNMLNISAGGNYKLPLIYKDSELLELPKIELSNITVDMDINSSILHSILQYNTKELQAAKIVKSPVQRMYYIDNNGAITFTTGACVNNFTLDKPVKLLLGQKVVKLFKLFPSDTAVKFSLSNDLENNIIITKVKFVCSNIELSALIPSDNKLIESVPVSAIRNMSVQTYDYSVVVNKDSLLKALTRLLLFKNNDLTLALEMKFSNTSCTLQYCNNSEVINYSDEQTTNIDYTLLVNIETLKNILDSCIEEYVTLSFGDHKAIIVTRQSIKNIIPELVSK